MRCVDDASDVYNCDSSAEYTVSWTYVVLYISIVFIQIAVYGTV